MLLFFFFGFLDASKLRNNLDVSEFTNSSDNSVFDDYENSDFATLAVHSSPKASTSRMPGRLNLEDPFPNESFLHKSLRMQQHDNDKDERNIGNVFWYNGNENCSINGKLRVDSVIDEYSKDLIVVEDFRKMLAAEDNSNAKGLVNEYSGVPYEMQNSEYGQVFIEELKPYADVKQESSFYRYPEIEERNNLMTVQDIKKEPGFCNEPAEQELIFVDNLYEESDFEVDVSHPQEIEHCEEIEISNAVLKDVMMLRKSVQGRKNPKRFLSPRIVKTQRYNAKRFVGVLNSLNCSRSKRRSQGLKIRNKTKDVQSHCCHKRRHISGISQRKVHLDRDILTKHKRFQSHRVTKGSSAFSNMKHGRIAAKCVSSSSKWRSKNYFRIN